MAGPKRPDVLPAAAIRQLSETFNCTRGAVLLRFSGPGRPDSSQYFDRAESAPGGPYYEEVLMREQIFSGPWSEVWILTILAQKAVFCGTECSW